MFRETVPDDRSRDVEVPGSSSSVAVVCTARSRRPTERRPAGPPRFAVAMCRRAASMQNRPLLERGRIGGSRIFLQAGGDFGNPSERSERALRGI